MSRPRSTLCVLLLAGCAAPPAPPVIEGAEKNLAAIVVAYGQASQNLKRPPQGSDELKEYLPGQSEELLRSPHDGAPFVIVWGVDMRGNHAQLPVLAYESKGVNGQRYVVDLMGSTKLLTDEEFRQAPFPAGHRPAN